MKKLDRPRNQHAMVVRLLIDHYSTGVTMVTAMKYFFHKFQSRLGEIEKTRKDKLKIRRLPITKKNRFGHTCTFLNYKSVANPKYLKNLYNLLNKSTIKNRAA